MLGSVGELPVNDLDEENELLTRAKEILALCAENEQARGWWFNTELATLTRDEFSQRIRVPNDVCEIRAENRRLTIRGSAVYDLDLGDFTSEEHIHAEIVRVLPVDQLPKVAGTLVERSAVLRFQRAYDADESKTRLLVADYQLALQDCNAAHTRNVRANPLMSPYQQHVWAQIGRPRNGTRGVYVGQLGRLGS